jgi:hypothetical protein
VGYLLKAPSAEGAYPVFWEDAMTLDLDKVGRFVGTAWSVRKTVLPHRPVLTALPTRSPGQANPVQPAPVLRVVSRVHPRAGRPVSWTT